MSHVAFVAAPLTGHVNPTLPVVTELVRRGHRVSYATTEEHADRILAAGAGWVPYRTTLRHLGQIPAGRSATADQFCVDDFLRAQPAQIREAAAVLPVLATAFGADPPDVLVYDPMLWLGRVLAARLQVPAVKSVTSLVSRPGWSLGTSDGWNVANPALPELFARIAAVLAAHSPGLSATALFTTDDGIPVIAYHPRAFQVEGDLYGPHVHFVGPTLPAEQPGWTGTNGGPEAMARRGAGRRPLVLVSLGTVFNRRPEVFRLCVDAFGGSRYRLVVALGGGDPAAIGPVPGNVEVHSYLPLQSVLPSVDVFISHCGMGSLMEALGHAVPVAAVPLMPEQRTNARRLAELGLGVVVDWSTVTAEGIRRAVADLARDAAVAWRLRWMRDEIRRAPGASAAAHVIEDVAGFPQRDENN
jgi:MGT family glycosyltransferase